MIHDVPKTRANIGTTKNTLTRFRRIFPNINGDQKKLLKMLDTLEQTPNVPKVETGENASKLTGRNNFSMRSVNPFQNFKKKKMIDDTQLLPIAEPRISRTPPGLTSLGDRSKEYLHLISQKGGQVRSVAKKEAMKLKSIKARIRREVASPEDAEWLLQKLEDRKSMAADLMLFLTKLKQEGIITSPVQKIMLLKTEADILKAVHGEKVKVESVNFNVNTTIEEWEARIASLMDDGEEY
jgi:hypothetical protein